jgi:hypothetical protein
MRSIELLGTYVIPELAKRGANGLAAGLQQGIKTAEQSVTARKWSPTPPAPELAKA